MVYLEVCFQILIYCNLILNVPSNGQFIILLYSTLLGFLAFFYLTPLNLCSEKMLYFLFLFFSSINCEKKSVLSTNNHDLDALQVSCLSTQFKNIPSDLNILNSYNYRGAVKKRTFLVSMPAKVGGTLVR